MDTLVELCHDVGQVDGGVHHPEIEDGLGGCHLRLDYRHQDRGLQDCREDSEDDEQGPQTGAGLQGGEDYVEDQDHQSHCQSQQVQLVPGGGGEKYFSLADDVTGGNNVG